jgi:hypothetical protein
MIELLINQAQQPVATFIFAHGAGAGKLHPFMEEVTELLIAQHINVVRFDFNYMAQREIDGKKRPPERMPKLIPQYKDVVEQVINHRSLNEVPLFIGGKSMGSRVAFSLLADLSSTDNSVKVQGAVAFGYPFHPMNKPDKTRLEPIIQTKKPMLILQGERDKLGNQSELLSYKLPLNCKAIFYTDGDHDLKPRVKSGYTQSQHLQQSVKQMVKFINEHK